MLSARTPETFGILGNLMARDQPSSSAWTREKFDWRPSHPILLADLEAGGIRPRIDQEGPPSPSGRRPRTNLDRADSGTHVSARSTVARGLLPPDGHPLLEGAQQSGRSSSSRSESRDAAVTMNFETASLS